MGKRISIGACKRAGDVGLLIYCVTQRAAELAPYSGGPNVCGHRGEMDIDDAIATFGADASLSDLRFRCENCGGRNVDVRGKRAPTGEGGIPLNHARR